jgi:hypothetical protein
VICKKFLDVSNKDTPRHEVYDEMMGGQMENLFIAVLPFNQIGSEYWALLKIKRSLGAGNSALYRPRVSSCMGMKAVGFSKLFLDPLLPTMLGTPEAGAEHSVLPNSYI